MSTSLDLAGYGSVRQGLFIKLTIPDPNDTPPAGQPRANLIYRVSTFDIPVSVASIEGSGTGYYDALGVLIGVSQFQNELRPSANDVTLSLSAIPQSVISEALRYPIKGAPIEIRRAFFNADTNELLAISGNPAVRYKGIVNNYSYNEDYNEFSQDVTFVASITCSSAITVLGNRLAGRMTNQESWENWSNVAVIDGGFGNATVDISMNRVSTIATTNWNFGGPARSGAGTTPGGGGGGGGRNNDQFDQQER